MEALESIRRTNPLPAVCGRVCPHPCEANCNRAEFDQGINIRIIERLLGDYGLEIPPSREGRRGEDKRVAVVGGGPAGLSAAYFLAKHGVAVDLYERERKAGGLLRYGIPEYRLPRKILDREIENIFHLGVSFLGEREIRPEDLLELIKAYDYTFFSPGLWGSRLPDWGYSGRGLHEGLSVLRAYHAGEMPDLGRRVAVVGGGNTALDVTRLLMRLGKEVIMIYRRTLQEAPAFEDEIREALEEEIQVVEKRLVTHIEARGEGGLSLEIRGVSRKNGGIVASGEKDHMIVDSVVAAVGQTAEMEVEKEGNILFGGDFDTGAGTVAHAIGSGRRGALAILKRLEVCDLDERKGRFIEGGETSGQRVVNYHEVNPAFFRRGQRFESRRRDPGLRTTDFDEVVHGATMEEALSESNRCFACGTCTLCNTCWYFCPDACVILGKEGGQKVVFDLDFCKGCAICSVSCPRGCILMVEEQ